MITCPRCQHQNPDSAKHCELCGAHLVGISASSSSHKVSKSDTGEEVHWGNNDAPDLFGLTGDVEPHKRVTGNLPGLKIPPPRSSSTRNPPGRPGARGSGPAGLAKLLQDALTTNSGGKRSQAQAAAAQIGSDTFEGRAVEPSKRKTASSGAHSKPAQTVGEEDLSDFLLDALSQSPEQPAPRVPPRRTNKRAKRPPTESKATHRPAAHIKAGSITCGSCGGSNPKDMDFCVHCGTSLETIAEDQPATDNETECQSCGTINPEDNRFCGSCGYPLASGNEAPNWQDSIASSSGTHARHQLSVIVRLVSINEDGSDGVAIPLDFRRTVVGRSGDTRFPTDAFLSPKHAAVTIDNSGVFIEDLYSLNGTFVKLRDEVVLTPGDIFLMGRQVLRFERFEQTITPKARSSDGTRYMGSPPPGGKFKLLQIGIGGVVQNVYCIPDNGAVLGREQGEIIFPRDKFMSSRHAQLYPRDEGKFCLVDLNSSNGTWIKIWERTRVQDDDYVFLGQQLFRVEVETRS